MNTSITKNVLIVYLTISHVFDKICFSIMNDEFIFDQNFFIKLILPFILIKIPKVGIFLAALIQLVIIFSYFLIGFFPLLMITEEESTFAIYFFFIHFIGFILILFSFAYKTIDFKIKNIHESEQKNKNKSE